MVLPAIEYESVTARGGMRHGGAAERGWGARFALLITRMVVALLPLGLVAGCTFALVKEIFGMLGEFVAAHVTPPVTILMVFIPLAALAQVLRSVRRRRGAQVLSYVEQAVRLNLPLPRLLRAAWAGETGKLKTRLAWLGEMVEAGAPLGLAVEATVPEVPGRSVELIKAAERLGRLPATLRRLVEQNRRARAADPLARIINAAYPLAVLASFMIVVTMIAIFVLPKYEQIFKDFRLEMPGVTRGLMNVLEVLALPVMVLAGLAIVIYTGQRLWDVFAPPSRSPRPLALTDRLLWSLPVVRGIARDRGLADACALMAEAAEAGYPLDRALLETTELRANRMLLEKLRNWGQRLREGVPPDEAARRSGLPPLVAGMMATVHAGGGHRTAEVLRFLSRYYENRFSRTAVLVQNALAPAVAIGFGVVVAILAWGMFAPMVKLVDRLSSDVGRL